MSDINERLAEIRLKMAERERLKGLIEKLEETRNELKSSKEELHQQLKKEELDVEKLEGLSIWAVFHTIKGDKNEQLDKERSEAFSAKLKYDTASAELDRTISEIDEINQKLWSYVALDRDYDELIAEKEKSVGQDAANKIHDLLEKQAEIKIRNKEVGEALSAGRSLLGALDGVKESLKSARDWGTWDMLGGGIISTSMKHSHLDDAKMEIDEVQSLLRRFHRELGDIGEYVDVNIEIDSFLKFADYFFDGFFVDWSVQSKIEDAQYKVDDTISRIESLMYKLETESKNLDRKILSLESEKKAIIENA